MDKVKKWKIIRMITAVILIIFIVYLGYDVINCMKMKYPHPMLGIEAFSWVNQFIVDLFFCGVTFGIPIIINVILLIVSILRIKKYERT